MLDATKRRRHTASNEHSYHLIRLIRLNRLSLTSNFFSSALFIKHVVLTFWIAPIVTLYQYCLVYYGEGDVTWCAHLAN